MIRNSMRFVGWVQRKAVCAELRNVYSAPTEQAGLAELDAFEAKYAQRYPAIASSWRSNWERVATVLRLPSGPATLDLHNERDRVAQFPTAKG